MIICQNEGCFFNNPANAVMCDDCLKYILLEHMSMEDLYEMFVDTKEVLDQEGLFEDILRVIDPELAADPNIKENIQGFKDNLFDIFNTIMKEKMANEDK